MKRLALLATMVGGLAVGIAGCSEAAPPAAPTAVENTALLWPWPPPADQVKLACRAFVDRIGWRYDLTPEERGALEMACERLTEKLAPMVPLDRTEICRAIMGDEAFASLPPRVQEAIRAFCSRALAGTH